MGLGMHKIKDFWNSLKLPWLHQLAAESSWKNLHREEVGVGVEIFYPFTVNESKIKKVCKATKNPVWREIYGSLLKCKQNMVRKDPMNILLCLTSRKKYTIFSRLGKGPQSCWHHWQKLRTPHRENNTKCKERMCKLLPIIHLQPQLSKHVGISNGLAG